MQQHPPVMVAELLGYLSVRPEGCYADCTTGLGGHTGAIARQLGDAGHVYAFDRDAESIELARANTADVAAKVTFRKSSFREFSASLEALGVGQLDGLVADLGVSRMQLTSPTRGLSFQHSAPIDMRLDASQELTAGEIVNRATERELEDLFVEMADERRPTAQRLARAIGRARPLSTTTQLADVVATVVRRTGKLHPATKVFQALRIATNDELGQIEALLEQAPAKLKPGARWVMISFHSLEDTRVKQAFRELGRSGRARILTKHVVRPGQDEKRKNPASRSAVLRAVEMI